MLDPINQAKPRGNKVFYGWWVVTAGSLLNALAVSSVFYGFNTFFNPMIDEFGWSRTATSGAFSLTRLQGGIQAPFTGWLTDKFGARKVSFVSVSLVSIGFIALIFVTHNILSLYLIFGLVLSLGYSGFSQTTNAVAAKWFVKKRSTAVSFITVGTGLGGAVIVPILAWLITHYGWREAAVILGLVIFIFGLPLVFMLRSTPEEMGMLPDGELAPQKSPPYKGTAAETIEPALPAGVNDKATEFTVAEAMKTRAFWILTAAMVLRASVLGSIVIHEIPYLVDMGIDYQVAAGILGIMVLISTPARFIFGWLGDRFDKRILMLITCLLQGLGILVLINATNLLMVYLFVTIYGVGYGGAIPLPVGMVADLFGRKNFATLSGIIVPFTAVTTVTGPVFLGHLYDATKSYIVGFYVLLAVVSLSGFTFLLVRQPKLPFRANSP